MTEVNRLMLMLLPENPAPEEVTLFAIDSSLLSTIYKINYTVHDFCSGFYGKPYMKMAAKMAWNPFQLF